MSWGTLLPRHICWSYYYDPRCFRESPSNLAMLCVPSVMILVFILESIPWCYLVLGILLLGFEPEIHSTYFMLIVFASSFRKLVTFALVLEVRGVSFFQMPWTAYGRRSWPKDHNRSALDGFSIHNCDSARSTFPHGLSGRNMLNSFDMLIYAFTTQKIICSFELSLFSCSLALVYQLIVRSNCAFVHPVSYTHLTLPTNSRV